MPLAKAEPTVLLLGARIAPMSGAWTCGHTHLEKSGTNDDITRIITVGRVRISITSHWADW
jgi:hypothetical protein